MFTQDAEFCPLLLRVAVGIGQNGDISELGRFDLDPAGHLCEVWIEDVAGNDADDFAALLLPKKYNTTLAG